MRVSLFYHSLVSDWNHGNAHFLRGFAGELQRRGHRVDIYEPADSWSMQHLLATEGCAPVAAFHRAYPHLRSTPYTLEALDLNAVLDGVDLVIVHEWNDVDLVRELGEYRATHDSIRLLFHDTHHRSVSDSAGLAACDLQHYDGVLAYGRVIRDRYVSEGWARRAWTWHEAADVQMFKPIQGEPLEGDLVWIGNWGEGERTEELHEFLLEPVTTLGLRAKVYGVRYPPHALRALEDAGIEYGGWLPNHEVPRVFARFRATVHVPRRPYVESLPGIPTIRPFEALACGIPLVSASWQDVEGLFHPGGDYLVASNGAEMTRRLAWVLTHPSESQAMAGRGLDTIRSRHTCAHRVDELLAIHRALPGRERREVPA